VAGELGRALELRGQAEPALAAMNEAVATVARQYLDGHEPTEGLLNHIEVAIRAFDPCLSCATHALGRMPLVVEVRDAHGEVVGSLTRDA
jgi:NAD-reducing hydrogenase large subunit